MTADTQGEVQRQVRHHAGAKPDARSTFAVDDAPRVPRGGVSRSINTSGITEPFLSSASPF
jgi:hypothetical protein